jgi:hypothetical protein
VILLYSALIVKKNLSWYLMNNFISREAGSKLEGQINELIKAVANHASDLCEGFGIPKHSIYAPIYTGYEDYYKVDITNGEHHNIPNRPKF